MQSLAIFYAALTPRGSSFASEGTGHPAPGKRKKENQRERLLYFLKIKKKGESNGKAESRISLLRTIHSNRLKRSKLCQRLSPAPSTSSSACCCMHQIGNQHLRFKSASLISCPKLQLRPQASCQRRQSLPTQGGQLGGCEPGRGPRVGLGGDASCSIATGWREAWSVSASPKTLSDTLWQLKFSNFY